MAHKIYSIKCTNCAAPLKIRGGGRVSTITCEYCHSLLDMNDKYAILSKFSHTKRPNAPFHLGMKGKIKGVVWTIIAWITYKTVDDDPTERWSEFFLYSPTHGYAWLVYDNHQLFFSKRVRDFPLREWSHNNEPKTLFYQKGHYFQTEAPYAVQIEYVEGELSWIAKSKDEVHCHDYNGTKNRSLSILEKSGEEIEVYLNEKLDSKEVYDSFGIGEKKRVLKTKTFRETILDDALTQDNRLSRNGLKIILLLLFFAIIASFFHGKQITSFSYSDMNQSSEFSVNSNLFLTKITLSSSTSGLKAYSLTLYKDNKKQFYIDKNGVYFINKSINNTWKSTAISATIYLKLDKGKYTLKLQRAASTSPHSILVTIEESIIRLSYLLPLFIILGLFLLYLNIHFLSSKHYMVIFLLIAIIVGYTIFGPGALVLLGFILYYIYKGYIKYKDEDN